MKYQNEKLIAYKNYIKGKTASVIGVGISNIPLVDFLLKNGVKVTARDKKPLEKLRENPKINVDKLISLGVKFVCGEEYLSNITDDIIYKSPGIRFDKPEIAEACRKGSIITGEMEAFISLCPSRIIAVTGSNGKTTTTTLVAKILENAGKKVWLGGNIGRPLLSQIEEIRPEDFTVLELSSFQLHTINRFKNDGLPFAKITFPHVGVITNVSPNHLDWHTDMEEYASAKKAVFSHMSAEGVFVTNRSSDEYTSRFSFEAADRGIEVRTFSAHDDGCFGLNAYMDEKSGDIFVNERLLMNKRDIVIPGLHNVENYMAAILATYDFVKAEDIVKTAKTFTGVPHRLELVCEKENVRYYNSSIDSSPSRTLAALSCFGKEFDGKIHIILGGYDKHIPFDELAPAVLKRKIKAYITGHTGEKIYSAITGSSMYDPKKHKGLLTLCENFEAAVRSACSNVNSGDVVLLSPACASFDEFDNFEQRGNAFKQLVNEIVEG